MKTLTPRIRFFCAVAMALAGLAAHAQMPGAGPVGGMNASLTKLFGETKAFSAKASVRVLDSTQKETVSMPLDFALLEQQVRVEVNMAQMTNRDMPPGAADQLKKMGMAQVTSIIRPDKKMVYVIYPEAKVLMTMPMSKAEADSAYTAPKLTKTEEGKETVDGHPCVKNKVVLTQDDGQKIEATTWNATDLKDFPVQILTQDQGNSSFILFRQIQFTKPEAKLFDPPTGFTEYSSPAELMQGVVKRMTEGAAPK